MSFCRGLHYTWLPALIFWALIGIAVWAVLR